MAQILLDDNQGLLIKGLRHSLEQKGFVVATATDGRETVLADRQGDPMTRTLSGYQLPSY